MIDGRMHGEGLYVWQDGTEYAGEFNNGCMSGQGERRWQCGRRYCGEWRKDTMWGEGELTWPTGESYVGQFRRGAFHGKGIRVWPSGDRYSGEFHDGEQEGEGSFRSGTEGWRFTGRWLHGRMYGEGRVEWPDGITYVGEWKDGIREGHGHLTWPDGSSYEGPFFGNRVEGHGSKSFPDGSSFEGQFVDGEFDGQGVFRWPDGTEFAGEWSQSDIVGPGCHRFPDGTTITGTFTDGGACGEGTKTWPNGCVYTGILLHNRIDRKGTMLWPDGRKYVGDFENDAMHGEGTLVWAEGGCMDSLCTYRGQFRSNAFEGRGTLELASGAKFEGEFRAGLYHGEGSFTWPGDFGVYDGQWANGDMCGHGELTCNGGTDTGGTPYVYEGTFHQGHAEGKGQVIFSLPSLERDQYHGLFKNSKFNGLGTFLWSSGVTLIGLFEDNYCNRVGRKIYPDGRVYTGELRYDLEHGKGVQVEGGDQLVALWADGKVVQQLVESCAPELDLDLKPDAAVLAAITAAAADGALCDVVGGAGKDDEERAKTNIKKLLPVSDEQGVAVEGKALVTFLNGDRYVGHMWQGHKHGRGMYVYADLATYKGVWVEDVLDGVRHPVSEDSLPIEVRRMEARRDEEPDLEDEARDVFRTRSKRTATAPMTLSARRRLPHRMRTEPMIGSRSTRSRRSSLELEEGNLRSFA